MNTPDPWDELPDFDRDTHRRRYEEMPPQPTGSAPILLILLGVFLFCGALIWAGIELVSHILNLP